MISRQQRRAEERAEAKRGGSGGGSRGGGNGHDGDNNRGGISVEDAIAKMTGVGSGNKTVTIDDLPEAIREMYRKQIQEMEAAGMAPISLVEKPDGSYSMFTAPTFEGLDQFR